MSSKPPSPTPAPTDTNVSSSMLLYIGVAIVLFIGGVYAGLRVMAPQAPVDIEINGIYFDTPKPLVDVSLIGDDGKPWRPAAQHDQWSVLYFGYTFCPDVCPTTLAQLAQVRQRLLDEQIDDLQFVLVSVDPARDTPERLAEYVQSFGERFHGATGDRDALDRLTESLGIYYKIHPPEDGEDYYLVDHSSTLILLDPNGKLHAVLTPPFTPAQLTEDIARVRSAFIAKQ